ncbi:MAG: RHS repeat domain-containing protein, partial [Betaproteobacteria bacterium]
MVSHFDQRKTTYSLPGGGGGRVLGQVPAGLGANEVQSLLDRFGFSATDTIGYAPGSTSRSIKTPLIQMGSDGSLVVGLRTAGSPGQVTDEVSADIQDNPSSIYRWDFPRRMLVIQGEVAYEFHYVNHSYMTLTIPYLAISQKTQLYSGHYLLTKIRNKFGERIDFTYNADGIGYIASWSTKPTVRICVQKVGQVAISTGQPSLNNSVVPVTSAFQIRVSYEGVSQPISSYLLEVSNPEGGLLPPPVGGAPDSPPAATGTNGVKTLDFVGFDTAMQSIQPIRVVQEISSEQMTFSYGLGPTTTWGYGTISPTVLSGITFPTRTVSLVWQPYPFRMNYSAEGGGGMVSSSAPGRPAYGYGVTAIQDSDSTQTRVTTHKRVVPTSNWSDLPLAYAPPDQWVDTTFYDAITHPDGTTSVHRFVEPTNAVGDSLQTLAFIKTLEREVRYYAPGVKWEDDLSVTTPATSSAYKWVVKDRFDVRTPGSPEGSLAMHSVPYPTRTRTWDRESQVFTLQETTDWDGTAFGWKTTHTTTAITPAPAFTLDYLSLAQQGLGYSPYPATLGLYRRVDKTFEPKVTDWIFARTKTEQSTTVADNTGSMASDVPLPNPQPLVTKTFNPRINRVESVAVSNVDAPTVTTAFTFQGTTGLAAFELQSAYLTSPNLVLSGQLGVSAYGYDPNGYLNAISQKPSNEVTLKAQQESDELGRPTSQTDVNGVIKTFTRDQAGRLRGITSSDNEAPTTITYDDNDHRGITVTRGAQATEYRYNGFGELILERRTAPDGVKTHRLFGYDAAGRKTAETVWQPGDGANHEAEWIKPNLTRKSSTTTTTPSITVCKRYGFDADGNAICLSWQTIPGGT